MFRGFSWYVQLSFWGSDSGIAVSSVGSVVITVGMHPLGVLLKDHRLKEDWQRPCMTLESVRSRSSKSGTLDLTIIFFMLFQNLQMG